MIGAETVTRVRAARLTDSQGAATPQRDWANAARTTVAPVSVQPVVTGQTQDVAGIGVRGDWELYDRVSPDGFWVAGDRVEWSGRTLDVIGDPQAWHGPHGGQHHWQVVLREQPPTPVDTVGTQAALRAGIHGVVDEQVPWTP